MVKQLIGLILLIALGYGLVEAWPLIAGPHLTLTSPTSYGVYGSGIVPITGEVERAAELTLNGAPLLRDQNGTFSSTLTLPQGGSILTFVARDRFGRTVTERRTILVP